MRHCRVLRSDLGRDDEALGRLARLRSTVLIRNDLGFNRHRTSPKLVAFSDGVLAIIITIMVIEMKVPHGDELGIALAWVEH